MVPDMNDPKKEFVKNLEKELVACLINLDIITTGYQGEVVLHFSEGGLTDIDRFEKSIRRRLRKNGRNNNTTDL